MSHLFRVELPEKVAARYRVDERYGTDDWGEWHEYLVPSDVLNAHPVERLD